MREIRTACANVVGPWRGPIGGCGYLYGVGALHLGRDDQGAFAYAGHARADGDHPATASDVRLSR